MTSTFSVQLWKSRIAMILHRIKRKAINLTRGVRDLWDRENGLIKRRIGKHIYFLDPNDTGISARLKTQIEGDGDREPEFMHLVLTEVVRGMTCFDLGANLGHITLNLCELVGPEGKVYAVEPSPHNFKILFRNIETNGYLNRAELYQLGISNENGTATFYASDKTNLGGMTPTAHTKEAIQVPVQSLDAFLEGRRMPNFIKMDIEGHEVEAFEGMMKTAESTREKLKILLETHPTFYNEQHDFEKVLREFVKMGFRIPVVVSAGLAEPDFFREKGYRPERSFDVGRISRAIYRNVSVDDAIVATCRPHRQRVPKLGIETTKIVRAIMLERN